MPGEGTKSLRIGIYKEHGSGAIGGAEYMMAVLAESLTADHDVEMIHHHDGPFREQMASLFQTPLDGVRMRYEPVEPRSHLRSALPWRKYRAAKSRYAQLSEGLDLFVALVHGEEPPPFCHARMGMLVVLFPLSERPARWPLAGHHNGWAGKLKERVGRAYLDWEWRQRLGSYRIRTSISEYVRRWTRELWGIDSELLYPPVDARFVVCEKANRILSVGRFCELKNQWALADAFRNLCDAGLQGWTLTFCGGVGSSDSEKQYIAELRRRATGYPIDIHSNISRDELNRHFAQAAIFWHAAGFGVDERHDPGQSEHFGIVTVEAMAAGCVPVVIRKGGQPELIEHGATGYLWNTLDELMECTHTLVNDKARRDALADAARKSARRFSKDAFVARFSTLLKTQCSLAVPPATP